MNTPQLRGDLKEIEAAIGRSTVDQATKRLLGEVVEWQKGLVDQVDKDMLRMDGLEGAVNSLLAGVEEGIAPETAQILLAAYEQSRNVCKTIAAFLEGPLNTLDDVTTKTFMMLLLSCSKATAEAIEVVNEIVIEEEDAEGEDADEDADADESDEDEAVVEGEDDEEDANG